MGGWGWEKKRNGGKVVVCGQVLRVPVLYIRSNLCNNA